MVSLSPLCPALLRCLTQLLNNGEQGEKTYAEAVPWLETAYFGGVLAGIEVSTSLPSAGAPPSPPLPVIVFGMPQTVLQTYEIHRSFLRLRRDFRPRGASNTSYQHHCVRALCSSKWVNNVPRQVVPSNEQTVRPSVRPLLGSAGNRLDAGKDRGYPGAALLQVPR